MTVSPDEALKLTQEGVAYIDVRNQLEFEQGHPAGSYNVPIVLQTDFGPQPNDAFVDIVAEHFGRDARLIVGCATGVRSKRAVKMLEGAGFTNLVEQTLGFNGWRAAGLPVELGQPDGHSYEDLAPKG